MINAEHQNSALIAVAAALVVLIGACDNPRSGGPPEQVWRESARVFRDIAEVDMMTTAPQWVLRDADGHRVQALVEPRCGNHNNAKSISRCRPLDFASPNSFPCVRIIDHEGVYLNILYDLETGQVGPCQGGTYTDIEADIKHVGSAFYMNDKCEGQPYFHLTGWDSNESFTAARDLYYFGGKVWYQSGQGCADAEAWTWDPMTNECLGPGIQQRFCPMVSVPDWVFDLLPNPPYSMAVEYD